MAETPKKTFKGSCHCGAITYEAHMALPNPPVASRCNCTVCQKSGFVSLPLDSLDDFVLKTPKSLDDVTDYQYGSTGIHRYFCNKCSANVFSSGSYEYEGTVTKFQNINAMTLDQPQEGLELSEFKIEYWDGRKDNWMGGKQDKPYASGLS